MREEIKAAAVIIASLLILSAFVILTGGRHIFENYDIYYTKTLNASGLEKGSQVKLGGVKVGRVLDIREPEGPGQPVTIALGMKKGTSVYKGTRALITQTGFLGDMFLLLAVDRAHDGRIGVGEVIPSEERTDFSVMLARLDELSRTANKAIISLSSNLEQVASSLKATTDETTTVLNEVEEIVKTNKGDFSKLIRSARNDLDKAGEAIASLKEAARKIDSASGSAGETIDVQSQNLDNLINSLTKATEDLRDVIQEIQRKPWSILYKEKEE